MRITLAAIGRLRKGPEADLVADYLDRFAKTGRSLGLPKIDLIEIEDKRQGGSATEAPLLLDAIPSGAALVLLDERGSQPTSPELANDIANWRDQARDICFMIGGADGVTDEIRARADKMISFGRVVWPHMLVRAMLCEQIYRAATILSGSPYHRN